VSQFEYDEQITKHMPGKGADGDAANAILTAVGYNLRLVLAWLWVLLRLILSALCNALLATPALKSVC